MPFDVVEGDPDIRYGWYLRPSYEMSRAQAEMHDLLRRQFGLVCGGVFMPHATIKGFYRSDAPVAEMIAVYDRAVAGHHPFPIYNAGPVRFSPRSIVLDVNALPDGSPNEPLQSIHRDIWHAITPLVHPECDFTWTDSVLDRFHAHLTLVMADLDPRFQDEVFEFVEAAMPIGPSSFMAEYFHFFAFHSEDWSGKWWLTLEWQLLQSWKLAGETGA
ncbi:MAG TPA: 2'-5' RNA ligase family protein [Thermomicrobiales bacterium]|nr:2'-5' RNA ligase family protein [Thermomicrobiales bacterium]